MRPDRDRGDPRNGAPAPGHARGRGRATDGRATVGRRLPPGAEPDLERAADLLPDPAPDPATAIAIMTNGTLRVVGRLVEASNATLYCRASGTGPGGKPRSVTCVYKPVRGERPLWDFPIGTLANREYAAYLVSEAAGWAIPPPTLLRDGPFGPGMVQLWVQVDAEADVVDMVRRCDERLRRIALFDVVVNNADRKGGHLLPLPGGHVHGVDHGICFAAEPKLRTILWGWRGTPISRAERDALERLRTGLRDDLGDRLRELLSAREVAMASRRLDRLLAAGTFPQPDPDRPAIPWPPF